MSSAGEPVTVLAIGAGDCLLDLQRILGHSLWTVLKVATLREAEATLAGRTPLVVVCEASLADGTWKDVLDRASRSLFPPPVLVTSCLADDRLWMDVLSHGGYNVLAPPFDRQEVFRILSQAWLSRKDRPQAGKRAS